MEDALRLIDRWLSHQAFINEIPGLSLGIVKGNKLVFEKYYGFQDIENKRKTQENTLYRVASISKFFTAVAIMQLVEKKKLSLNNKASKFLPRFRSDDKELEKITIKQLLTHLSKLKRDGDFPYWTSETFPSLEEIKRSFKNKQTVDIQKQFKYSNFGYAVLGEIISQVSGEEYSKYIEKNILQILDMKNTFVDLNKKAESNLAKGYSRKLPGFERRSFIFPKTQGLASATGFISNILDMSKLVVSLLNNSRIISEKSKNQIFKKEVKSEKNVYYGLGCEIWISKENNIFGHGGGFAGYKTSFGIDRKNKTGVILMTNSIGVFPETLMRGVFDILNSLRKQKNKKSVLNEEKYEGVYSSKWGFVQIAKTPSGLIGVFPNSYSPLKDTFSLEYQHDSVYKIVGGDGYDHPGENINFFPEKKIMKIGPNTWKLFKPKQFD